MLLHFEEASSRSVKRRVWNSWPQSQCSFLSARTSPSTNKSIRNSKGINDEGWEQVETKRSWLPWGNTPHEAKPKLLLLLRIFPFLFRMKGWKKWTFERKYYRLLSWWRNFQHHLDTLGRKNWRRWYFWVSGGQWLKAEAERLRGWGIWKHRCRHWTDGQRMDPPMRTVT